MGFADMLTGGLQGAQGYIAGLELARQHQMQQLQLQNTEEEMEQQRRLRPLQVDQASANVGLTRDQGTNIRANTDYTTQRMGQDAEMFPVKLDVLRTQGDMFRSQADLARIQTDEARQTSKSRVESIISTNTVANLTNQAMIDFGLPGLKAESDWIALDNAIKTGRGMSGVIDLMVDVNRRELEARGVTADKMTAENHAFLKHVWSPGPNGERPKGVDIWLRAEEERLRNMGLQGDYTVALTNQANAIANNYYRGGSPTTSANLADDFTNFNNMSEVDKARHIDKVNQSLSTANQTVETFRKSLVEAEKDLEKNPADPLLVQRVKNIKAQKAYQEGRVMYFSTLQEGLVSKNSGQYIEDDIAAGEAEAAAQFRQSQREAVRKLFPNIGNVPAPLLESVINFVNKNQLHGSDARAVERAWRNDPSTADVRKQYSLNQLSSAFTRGNAKPAAPSQGATKIIDVPVYSGGPAPAFRRVEHVWDASRKAWRAPDGTLRDNRGAVIRK